MNRFIIFVQADTKDSGELHYTNISQQSKEIKEFLSKNATDILNTNIIYQNNSLFENTADILHQELNTKIKPQSIETLFPIKSKIFEKNIAYDKTFLLGNFSKSKHNQCLVINIIQSEIAKITNESAETTILIAGEEYFKSEWPYFSWLIIIPNATSNDFTCIIPPFDSQIVDCFCSPLIITLPKKIHF